MQNIPTKQFIFVNDTVQIQDTNFNEDLNSNCIINHLNRESKRKIRLETVRYTVSLAMSL